MNKERILHVASVLDGLPSLTFDEVQAERHRLVQSDLPVDGVAPREFAMAYYRCGTAACIGGWVESIYGDANALDLDADHESDVKYQLYEGAGLNDFDRCLMWDATSAQAAMVLRHLAETGVVDWARFLPAPEEA